AGAAPGPVPIRRHGRAEWAPAHAAFHDALRDLGAAENPDLARAEHQGVGPYARNASDGRRMGAALTHLIPALGRPNLTVRGGAVVHRVAFDGTRAVGVDVELDGRVERIAAGEVVLSAGAIETPQLLVHSGIGPAATAARLGIAPLVDLPGVGEHLTDHPSIVVAVRFHERIRAWDLRCLVGLVATSTLGAASGARSDVQTLVMSGPYVGTNGGHVPLAPDPERVDCVLNPILYAPESVGRVEVVSADPRARPRIHYDYLRSDADRARLREALRLTGRVLAHPAFAELIDDDAGAPDERTLADDDLLDAWMRPALRSTLHGCGTCRIGPEGDALAVVDGRCRVRGVEGLSVVDLSVVPRAPTAPTNATAMAVAERVAAGF
ncbi:GMC family oxidoreductase, partial [Patulibacter sp. S7RM1-6]